MFKGMKPMILILAVALNGCALKERNDVQTLNANPDQVVVKAGRYVNPGEIASSHCDRVGKQAFLRDAIPEGRNYSIYVFDCR